MTDEQKAVVQAEALVRQYYAVLDDVGSDPTADLGALESVAISQELAVRQQQYTDWRRDGWQQSGKQQLADVVPHSVNLDNSDPANGRVPSVQVDVCVDVSDVDVVDAAGTSVVEPDRATVGWVRHTVANYSWNTDPEHGWRVAVSEDLQQAPCEPAS